MTWIFLSLILGGGIGFYTYRYQFVFLGVMIASAPIAIAIGGRWLFLIAVVWTLPSSRDGDALNGDTVGEDVMGVLTNLPETLHWALFLFPVAIITARMLTWFFTQALNPEYVPETRDVRKARLHDFYGYDPKSLERDR